MSNFICPTCGIAIIKDSIIQGCEHYPKDDLTELSGKQMSDGMSIDEADRLAFHLLKKENGSI